MRNLVGFSHTRTAVIAGMPTYFDGGGDGADVVVNNPLSQASDSVWNVFFNNEQLQKEIMQDITRCYPDNEFFEKQYVRDMMLNILFIYAKQHDRVVYKQVSLYSLSCLCRLLRSFNDFTHTLTPSHTYAQSKGNA